jgi:hypothetical protein
LVRLALFRGELNRFSPSDAACQRIVVCELATFADKSCVVRETRSLRKAMSKKPILSVLAIVAAAYMAYPYVALYRLQAALQSGDPDRLAAMVDWDQVRDGLKQEVADQVIERPAPVHGTTQLAGNVLPPFGSGFMKGIASRAVDDAITPVTVARMIRPVAAEEGPANPLQAIATAHTSIEWAFFDDPTTFTLWLRTPALARAEAPVKLRMQLIGGDWKITRAWLPPSVLQAAR